MKKVVHPNPAFDDLPLIRLTSYQCPPMDGDIALLEELADRVLAHPRRHVAALDHHWVYHRLGDDLGYTPTILWPHIDPAAKLLKEWRRG